MVTNYEKFKAADTEILAISVDPPDKSQKLAEQLKIPYPLLSDDGHKVIDTYSILDPSGKISTAAVFILDKRGLVRWSYVASDYKVRPLDDTLLAELEKLK